MSQRNRLIVRLAGATILVATTLPSCGGSTPAASHHTASSTKTAAPSGPTPEQKVVSDLANLRWDQLGNPVVRWDAIPPVHSTAEKPHELLVVLVNFKDLRFERFHGDPQQGTKLADYYQHQLFDDTYQRKDTLSHYYAEQSGGAYHVTGRVLPPIELSKNRSEYGRPTRPQGGTWRNDVDPEAMVEEALQKVVAQHPDLPWSELDRWDPTDFDEDGVTDEPDGYLDHFVLVFAGGGQSSCQLLNKIDDVLTGNVGNEALKKLDRQQLECADRLWPHRAGMRRREGEGPTVGGKLNPRGGVPMTPSLWAFDYNMQSEYTASATFIHEFGHSIGLPDIYARTSTNSTGGWEVMSGTADPSPQNLSAWSRLMLGWLEPRVVLPPHFGGKNHVTVDLARAEDRAARAEQAVMVVLPPKRKTIDLGALPQASGHQALYSGQGNELNRTATTHLDLSKARSASVSLDAWWDIEGGWDFAYVEASKDGKSWERLLPTDRRMMPAKHGHDGKDTRPGLTGLSGDLDGDGKNESHAGCDPSVKLAEGEDRAGKKKNPCLEPTWVHVAFDLSDFVGSPDVRFRVRYYTDGAAVMRGILIDNVVATTDGTAGAPSTFEQGTQGWTLDGFSPSTGHHEILVPHYYLLEYRDPYAQDSYDAALSRPLYYFYDDPGSHRMMAMASRPRPGVVIWYFDGAYAWSENDPAINGPGHGYLLAVDANPNEIPLPGLESFMTGDPAEHDTGYDLDSDAAQSLLAESFVKTVCFVRDRTYWPRGGLPTKSGRCPGRTFQHTAPVETMVIDGKHATYSYKVINDFLPGKRDDLTKVSELVDTKGSGDEIRFRLRDRSLRYLHTYDSPFSPRPFERGRVFYEVKNDQLVETSSQTYPAVTDFASKTGTWIDPKLPFGGVDVPDTGVHIHVGEPAGGAPEGTRATVTIDWP